MVHEKTNVLIGVFSYAFGLVLGLNFFNLVPNFSFQLGFELAIISLGVLCMSIFFYSRFSFFLLFVIGMFFSPLVFDKPLFVVLSLIPLSLAHFTGIEIGVSVREDFFGRQNIYDNKVKFFAMALIVILLALIVGFISDYFVFSIPRQ
ncbi:MAG: hypothetical protein QXZ13_02185 [Candidatus Diapherotrites archaeon]